MEKVYKSLQSAMSIIVNVEGVNTRVSFVPKIISTSGQWGCAFRTSDEKIQKALESHPQFMNNVLGRFWVEPIAEPAVEQEQTAQADITESISTLKEAKAYIVKTFGIDQSEVSTKAKLLSFAAEHNVSFPNL